MRHVILMTAALVVLPVSAVRATFVELSILGEGGSDTVTIGPQGGRVAYTLFVETDPVGTPGNRGLASATITIETDTQVVQEPAMRAGPPFDFLLVSPGVPQGDDILNILIRNFSPGRVGPPGPRVPERGQSRPDPLARGELIIPAASIGTLFHATIPVDLANPDSSAATVWGAFGFGTPVPDALLGTPLTISVVPEPSMYPLLLVGLGLLGHRQQGAAGTGMTNRMEDLLCDPYRSL